MHELGCFFVSIFLQFACLWRLRRHQRRLRRRKAVACGACGAFGAAFPLHFFASGACGAAVFLRKACIQALFLSSPPRSLIPPLLFGRRKTVPLRVGPKGYLQAAKNVRPVWSSESLESDLSKTAFFSGVGTKNCG